MRDWFFGGQLKKLNVCTEGKQDVQDGVIVEGSVPKRKMFGQVKINTIFPVF
jgi:hypothetical protein